MGVRDRLFKGFRSKQSKEPASSASTGNQAVPSPSAPQSIASSSTAPTLTPPTAPSEVQTPVLVPVPSTQTTILDPAAQIWNDAYDNVKRSETTLAESYEKILSCQLQNNGRAQSIASPETTGNIIGQTAEARRDQMVKLVEAGLEKTKSAADIKGKVKQGMQAVNNLRGVISAAVQYEPHAAIAWVGVTVLMDIIVNPISEPEVNRSGVDYVLKKFQWFWELTNLVLDAQKVPESVTGLQDRLKSHIIELYQTLLVYQMQSVCLYNRHWATVLLRDLVLLDDWKAKVASVEATEAAIRQDVADFRREDMSARLRGIDGNLELLRTNVQAVEAAVQQQTAAQLQLHFDEKDQQCLRDLHILNPAVHKEKIEKAKGGLLKDSFRWILEDDKFKNFWTDDENRLLWIKGHPGKGKTMLLCGIIDELKTKNSVSETSYFFCQATEDKAQSATSVLRGLCWLLCAENPSLLRHVRERYDLEGKAMFSDTFALESMGKILDNMLEEESLENAVFVVDAIDECSGQRQELIDLIIEFSDKYKARWIVSSRNWPEIEEQLRDIDESVQIPLELNTEAVSKAVDCFIDHRVQALAEKKRYTDETRIKLIEGLRAKADNTFLWVALVCNELARPGVKGHHALAKLEAIPGDLDGLYKRMLEQAFASEDADTFKKLLPMVCVVSRPLFWDELRLFLKLDQLTYEQFEEVIASCGSFLSMQDDTVSFVHQSAKDFLTNGKSLAEIFPEGILAQHRAMVTLTFDTMAAHLGKNICQLPSPSTDVTRAQVEQDVILRPLAKLRYSIRYWIDHVQALVGDWQASDEEAIGEFLGHSFLHWLEALSLLNNLHFGIAAMESLKVIFRQKKSSGLKPLVEDAWRFVLYHKPTIEEWPLQLYTSCLLFSPASSLIRNIYHEKELSKTLTLRSKPEPAWNAHIQELDPANFPAHYHYVAFSNDGHRLVASVGNMMNACNAIEIWDVRSSHRIRNFTRDTTDLKAVQFSVDGSQLIAVHERGAVEILDADSGESVYMVRHRSQDNIIETEAFSLDGSSMALAGRFNPVEIWSLPEATLLRTLDNTENSISVSFSPDGRQLVISRFEHPVSVWDVPSGQLVKSIDACSENPLTTTPLVAFLAADSVAFSSTRNFTGIWDTKADTVQILDEDYKANDSIIWLGSGRCFAVLAGTHVKIWDDAGICSQTLYCHLGPRSLAFCRHTTLIASICGPSIRIWDLSMKAVVPTDQDDPVAQDEILNDSIVTSPSGNFIATARYEDILVSNKDYFEDSQTKNICHGPKVDWMVIDDSGRYLVSNSCQAQVEEHNGDQYYYETGSTKIWDLGSEKPECVQEFSREHYSDAVDVAPDRHWLALRPDSGGIAVWDILKRRLFTLPLSEDVSQVVFSPDSGYMVVRGQTRNSNTNIQVWELPGPDKEEPIFIQLWELPRNRRGDTTFDETFTHYEGCHVLAVSDNAQWVAVGSSDAIYVYRRGTRDAIRTLSYPHWIFGLYAISSDGQTLAAILDRGGVKSMFVCDFSKPEAPVSEPQVLSINTDLEIKWVRFEPNSKRLRTNVRVFDLADTSLDDDAVSCVGYGVVRFGGYTWITKGNDLFLHLPVGYFPISVTAAGSTVILGYQSKPLQIIEFLDDETE